jgi:hypothetical protein
VNGYTFAVTCPRCGGPLEHCATGRPTIGASRAVADCDRCRRAWVIAVAVGEAPYTPRRQVPEGPLERGEWDESAPFAPLIKALMEAS